MVNNYSLRAPLKVGVLMGGMNVEAEVSFNSGRTICDHLDVSKYEVIPLFQSQQGHIYHLPWHFLHRGKITDFEFRLHDEAKLIPIDHLARAVDFVYIAVHGRNAEDGVLQGMLELFGIPYLGTKVFGSALSMEKSFHKKILTAHDIAVPRGITLYASDCKTLTDSELQARVTQSGLSYPLIIKPSHEGSSFGITVVHESQALLTAVMTAAYTDQRYVQDVLIEEKITGMEFVCVLLEQPDKSWKSLPITEVALVQGSEFFDYEQKYMPGKSHRITPARCSEIDTQNIIDTCKKTAQVLACKTLARIDGILTSDGTVYIIDPNTLTGMSPSTFLFHQAAEVGMSHSQLINFLIEQELRSYGLWDQYFSASVAQEHKERSMSNVDKKRIAVLFGGDSNEREISLESGRNVCYKLPEHKYLVTPVFVNDAMELFELPPKLLIKNTTAMIAQSVTAEMQILWSHLAEKFDFVFLALHGGKGENGTVQGMLEMLRIPYNGPGVLTSSLCMDKHRTNKFLASVGFDVPQSRIIYAVEWMKLSLEEQLNNIKQLIQDIPLPLIIKPHDDGCSMFVSKVTNDDQILQALNIMFAAGKQGALIEEFIQGMELTVGVVGNGNKIKALPPSQAVASVDILSIEEKFLPGAGQNITPAPLAQSAISLIQETLERAFIAVQGSGYSRIDCFYQDSSISPTGKERIVFIEFNTLPALTPATCLFHQAAEVGIRPMALLDLIIELGFQKHRPVEFQVGQLIDSSAQAWSQDII